MFWFNMVLPIAKSPDIQWKIIEGQAVLLDIEEGQVLRLDDSGTKIWLMIDGSISGREIVDYFTENFEVSRIQAQINIHSFLKQMLRVGAIEFINKEA